MSKNAVVSRFRSAYDASVRVSKTFNSPTRTHQSFKNECDINRILDRWQKTGVITHYNKYSANYSDLTSVPDYRQAMDQIIRANQAFESLPSSLRKRFGNDPAEFLSFVSSPDNVDEMVKLGLANKRDEVVTPQPFVPAPGQIPIVAPVSAPAA